jgi:signal transduction histidine kinase/CheY-like chemotaxis protein
MNQGEELIFRAERPAVDQPGPDLGETDHWKVLIVDDEEEVHQVTRLVLKDFRYAGKGLKFLSAFSALQAETLIQENPDTAVILLDVVMEENDSGLKLARYIRENLKNRFARIILRTGQPGQAPESQVIIDYDINDYRDKTEITAQRLLAVMVSALRTYRDMLTIEASRQGLEKIIEASADIFRVDSMEKFASGVLMQLVSLLGMKRDSPYVVTPSFAAISSGDDGFVIKAACGKYEPYIGRNVAELPEPDILQCMWEARRSGLGRACRNKSHVEYFESKTGSKSLIYFEEYLPLDDLEKKLVEIFFSNVSIGFDNIYLCKQAEDKASLAEAALRKAESSDKEVIHQVSQRAESLQLIASAVAHQLRNPMTIIGGYAKLLMAKPELTARYGRYFEGILTSAMRMERIVSAVNEFNSIHLGQRRNVAASGLLAQARAQARENTENLGKSVDWTEHVEPLVLSVDQGLMVKALYEVMVNAVEALAEQSGTVDLRAREAGDWIMLEVSDTGQGMSEVQQAFVLDPFYTTKPVGIGMGLTLAQRIVQEHGGRLSLQSRPGAGTTVSLLLPLTPENGHDG